VSPSGVTKRIVTPVLVFVIALEIGLRIYNPLPFRVRGDHIVLPAHQSYTISHPGATKLDPVTHVTKNSLGFRGPEPPRDWARRVTILMVGGSTTECLFLSDGKTWTDQFARRVAAVRPDVWVNNAGLEGHSTFGHLVLLRDFVAALRPSIAVFLVGVNDMSLASPSPMDAAVNPQNLSAAHRVLTFVADHSEIGAVGENLVRMSRSYRASLGNGEENLTTVSRRIVGDADGERLVDEHRSKYLPGFTSRLAQIVEMSRAAGIEPVLMTQPALYGDGVDPTTGVALDTAAVGGITNGHVQWRVLDMYNDVTRETSARSHVSLVDLARRLPKDSKYFSDWIHYTNEGAVLVGDIVFSHLEPRLRRP